MAQSQNKPILYAEDSCPYVFRARIALTYAGIEVEHREITVENKPPALLEISPKGTVPVLVFKNGTVIDESWDIILWSIAQNDPEDWGADAELVKLAEQLKSENDRDFGTPSMYYKFPEYYDRPDNLQDRADCEPFLDRLESHLSDQNYMGGDTFSIADVPVYPAVNGVAKIDPAWFGARFPKLADWLDRSAQSPHVKGVDFGHTLWEFS